MGNTIPVLLIIFGLLIMISRGPLIFAPEKVRDIYLKVLETNKSTRLLGLFTLLIGIIFSMAARDEPGVAADLIYYLGYFLMGLAILGMLAFPSVTRKFGVAVWTSFSATTLRGIGILAVLFGLFLVSYGAGII